MKTKTRRVVLETRGVGQSFGSVGVIRDAKSRRKLAETGLKPFGFEESALDAARAIALKRGWVVVSDAAE